MLRHPFYDTDRREEFFCKIFLFFCKVSSGIQSKSTCTNESRSVRHKSEKSEVTGCPFTESLSGYACHDGNQSLTVKSVSEFFQTNFSILRLERTNNYI